MVEIKKTQGNSVVQSGEHLGNGEMALRVDELRRYFVERLQDETPAVEPGMGDGETGFVDDPVVVIENVNVDNAVVVLSVAALACAA